MRILSQFRMKEFKMRGYIQYGHPFNIVFYILTKLSVNLQLL